MTNDLDILILAAGLGTRMKSNLAKVLHRLDGRPLINHVCETAESLGPQKVCVVVGHQAADVEATVRSESGGNDVGFAVQKQQLGTGDAVNAAREQLEKRDSILLVLSGDVPMMRTETLRDLVGAHTQAGGACTVLTVELKDPSGYGRVIRDAASMFDRIVEQKDASDDERKICEINAGIYCFDTKKLYTALKQIRNDNAQGEYYLTDVPYILREQGDAVNIYKCTDSNEVQGVNDRRQLAAMEKKIRRATVSRLMIESGVTFIDPKASYVSARASMGRDTVIHPNVTIEGSSVIGEGCVIRPGTRITNSRIGDGVEIRDNCFITDSEVGDNCTVGPMAHLRGQAVMQADSKVGNFVELKKSNLGRGSKASHLTYLGDATIGENTNIGAGTVTCNYDGKNKHETHIGDNVKIGSDTMLIAPISVGDGAVTGAGSVVTKDVESLTLVVGAPAKSIRKLNE
ncbi:MAG: bifunctional UDP-N-acetylglucosamine diphosphorylase/glucosamine-1-phosphate N-acetyltransferase GlmU [Pyrinomonadaceae bacterium]